jgi:hypothetical protein
MIDEHLFALGFQGPSLTPLDSHAKQYSDSGFRPGPTAKYTTPVRIPRIWPPAASTIRRYL